VGFAPLCMVGFVRVQAEVRRREEEQRVKDVEEAKRRLLEEQLQQEEAEAEKEVCRLICLTVIQHYMYGNIL